MRLITSENIYCRLWRDCRKMYQVWKKWGTTYNIWRR